jgi:hypothetical protein
MTADPRVLADLLREPFDPSEVEFKPQAVKGTRALAIAYVDARVVQDRLDAVMGVDNWQDEYHLQQDGSCLCVLRLRFSGEWIQKVDVGAQSEQPDGGDRAKAAVSDALKRAAVKFGVGRYLYSLPHQWADYDPAKRCFTVPPRLPDWAIPKKKAPVPAATQQSRQSGPVLEALSKLEAAADRGPEALDQQRRATAASAMKELADHGPALDLRAANAVKVMAKPWKDWLKGEPNLPEFNERIPQTNEIASPAARDWVKKMCLEYAGEQRWTYDKDAKRFL